MARSTQRANTADSTPLVDPHTYTDGVGFEPGNAAKSTKYRTLEGKIVDDLKGEQGFVVVQEGDKVTPEAARMLKEGGPNTGAGLAGLANEGSPGDASNQGDK